MTVAINYPMLSIVGDIGEDYPVTEFIGSSSILKLMDGSRTTVDIGDNKVMETFKVFADATPVVIQANVRVVERHLAKAGQVERLQSPMERIRLFERLTDEARGRLSTILSGSITPIDEGVVSRTQYFSSAVYVVNITRRRLWEMTVAYDKFDALVHGGQFTLPEKMTVGTNSGRISLFAISGVDETVINEFWVGIKSAPSNYELNDFSPEIQVVHNIGRVNTSPPGQANFSNWSDGSDYIGGWAVQVSYGTGTDWARAYDTHLPDFNSVTAAGNSNAIYHGKYHLLIRYKTSFDYGERYGLRVKFGWKQI